MGNFGILPLNCPLSQAKATTNEIMYRLVKNNPPESSDFVSIRGQSPQKQYAAEFSDLFNESLANEIVQEFIQIIGHSDNQEELTKIIKYFQLRAARKYRDFLIELQTAGTQLSVDWVSPITNQGASVILKETTIQNAIIIIDQVESELPKVINVFGTLIGGNKRSEKFEMINDDQKTYRGDISRQVINSSINLTISQRYEFVIEETKKLKPATNEIFYSHKLIGLKQLVKIN